MKRKIIKFCKEYKRKIIVITIFIIYLTLVGVITYLTENNETAQLVINTVSPIISILFGFAFYYV